MIPKIIHQVWAGPRRIPKQFAAYMKGIRELSPGFKFCLWDNSNIPFQAHPYLQVAAAMGAWHRVADYQRVLALESQGGVYLDTDFELLRPLESLLHDTGFIGMQRGDDLPTENVATGIIGVTPGHWFPAEMRRRIERLDGGKETGSLTGPVLATTILRERGLKHYLDSPQVVSEMTLYPKRFFYPYHWEEKFTPQCITQETYAIHHWAHSWAPKISFLNRLRRLKQRLRAAIPRNGHPVPSGR